MAVPQEAQCPLRNGSFSSSGEIPDSIPDLSYSAEAITDPNEFGQRDWSTSISCTVEGCGLYYFALIKNQDNPANAIRTAAAVLSSRCETREFLAG
jgi:hypothetical protein